MIEQGIWHIIETALKYAVAPLIGLFWWMFKKNDKKMSDLEARMYVAERDIDVMDVQMKEIKEDIHEIKRGVDKLVDRLNK